MGKIEKDKKTLYFLIDLYCQKNHNSTLNDCNECNEVVRSVLYIVIIKLQEVGLGRL